MEREIGRAQSPYRRRRGSNPVRDFLRAHPALTVVLFLGLALGAYVLVDRAVQTDEEMIHETVFAVAEGMEDKDRELVLDQFSRGFDEDGVVDYEFLESRLPSVLNRANWGLSKPELREIQITDDHATVGQVFVIVAADGRPVRSRWRMRLKRETAADGSPKWRIIGAYPLSVNERSFQSLHELIRYYQSHSR
jgi:hypothetical protein